jgi:hypothetical protein
MDSSLGAAEQVARLMVAAAVVLALVAPVSTAAIPSRERAGQDMYSQI